MHYTNNIEEFTEMVANCDHPPNVKDKTYMVK